MFLAVLAGAADAVGTPGAVREITAVVLDISGEVESIDGMRVGRATPTTQTVIPTGDVLLALDSAVLGPQAQAALTALATELLAGGVAGEVRIDGHTDDQGRDALNLDLSRRRAESVAAVRGPLVAAGDITLVTQGLGEAHPRVANQDADGNPMPENQRRNRRVEITTTT